MSSVPTIYTTIEVQYRVEYIGRNGILNSFGCGDNVTIIIASSELSTRDKMERYVELLNDQDKWIQSFNMKEHWNSLDFHQKKKLAFHCLKEDPAFLALKNKKEKDNYLRKFVKDRNAKPKQHAKKKKRPTRRN